MENYESWADNIIPLSENDREQIAENVLNDFVKYGKKAKELANAIADKKEFEYYAFNTHLHFIPIKEGKSGKAEHIKWKKPHLIVKHKKLPLAIIIGPQFTKPLSKTVLVHSISKGMEIKQHLEWVNAVSKMSIVRKKALYQLLLAGIRSHRRKKKPGERWLSDFLENNQEFILKGFCVNCCYLRMEGDKDQIEPLWIHPWGTPQILFTHRDFPAMMVVGPALRLHQNIFGQKDMIGYTG
jgi:hypothetical protein